MKNTLLYLLTLCCFLRIHAQQPARYAVLLHEIMANPPVSSPVLPDSKYIELYNASPNAYDLYEWKISDGGNTAVIKEHFILLPDNFVIICPTSGAQALSAFGSTIGVSRFPALRVNSDMVWLLSDEDIVIHAVQYNRTWYENDVKSAGGWSLEMMDTKNPCSGSSNWKASADARGGTPGAANSIAGNNKDETAPQLLRAYATDSLHVLLVFDESLDSLQAAVKANYICSDGVIIEQAAPQPPFFNTVQLKPDKPLAKNKIYTLQVKNVSDCSGNIINPSAVKAGRDEMPETGDIVINEILFNPPANGSDYVELYNRSNHIISAKTLYMANRNSAGNINSMKQLGSEDLLIFPGDFIVITDNVVAVKEQFLVKTPGALIEITTMPSYPNASGTVVLLNTLGEVIDELRYDEKWHFELIADYKGVSLERIDYNLPTQDKNNWHSAAADAGYGTPTYQNSQFKANEQLQGEINISPGIFSPDNDGHDDFLTITYRFPEPGYVCNITVFDARGRTIRYLVRNGICGTEGYFRWDGLDEKNQQTSMGIYIILTEVYSLNGRTKKFKQAVTLARLRQ
ncbi:lamin tail domain-containing protein [Agriterribacter sp.]|uniref:lamin tail domain-containing protein n=1 Tax=Agriterribacter sp. TaxID=2821509 RepID=UPI002C0B26FD|nr:lamin tail domain-containing protein [Agriterribacter sp.]HRO44835.1 lamin tail domain-containing protein [Agriterribacter sp.]